MSKTKAKASNCVLVCGQMPDAVKRLEHLFGTIGYSLTVLDHIDQLTVYENLVNYAAIFILESDHAAVAASRLLPHIKDVPLILVTTGNAQVRSLPDGYTAMLNKEVNYSAFVGLVHRILSKRNKNKQHSTDVAPLQLFRSLVGDSPQICHVRDLIDRASTTETTVILLGESGTGKEIVARNIHYRSTRSDQAFVPVNCGAIPMDLLESELFGHEKGAFTNALSTRQGRFGRAHGGSIFLDEIGDMPLQMQVKLLRVLQERAYERLGSDVSIDVDVRVISATHRDLEHYIAEGKFREDLYYRLNILPIHIPALRERVEDLPLLIDELTMRMHHGKGISVSLLPDALDVLRAYPWPGNVRELANLIERLAIMMPMGDVGVTDLPEKFRTPPSKLHQGGFEPGASPDGAPKTARPVGRINLKRHMEQYETELIQQVLLETGWVIARAARQLGMGRTTLINKIQKYNLKPTDQVPSEPTDA